ncbi:MAG TPA: hypothetical protein PKW24_02365 [Clostridiales bacterium]|jgi:hypothetical protein|nr:hypothetical protein [Clostridiales bacterium]
MPTAILAPQPPPSEDATPFGEEGKIFTLPARGGFFMLTLYFYDLTVYNKVVKVR